MGMGSAWRFAAAAAVGIWVGCAAEPGSPEEAPDLTGFAGPTGTTIADSQAPGGAPPPNATPAADPPGTPPSAAPPSTTPPGTDPPGTTPPATTPPATDPPGTTPPAMTPPGTDPPATAPPMAGGGAEPVDSGTPPGTLAVEVTTSTYGGRYARDGNYGAIWVEKGDGTFLKTIIRWAGVTHARDLMAWTAASGGWGFFGFGGNAADQMDVISMATLRSHQSHMVTWDLKDSAGTVIADGAYQAVIEMTEGGSPTKVTRIPFTKGAEPLVIEHPDQPNLTDIVVRYQPE